VAGIDEARDAIAKTAQDHRNARVTLQVRVEQRDAAERHRGQFEAELVDTNAEIAELERTPLERANRAARLERKRLKAEAEAAEKAAQEAFLNELIDVCQLYSRRTEHGRTVGWSCVGECNQLVKIKRRDLPQHEADMAEAKAWFAKTARDELADEYADELRTFGRRKVFQGERDRVEYFHRWGPDSVRGRAYRERQRERRQSEADPPRLRRSYSQ